MAGRIGPNPPPADFPKPKSQLIRVEPGHSLIDTVRWSVKIREITGEDILADVLAMAGYSLDGDMLSGDEFEACDEWGKVADIAYDLAHRVREVARLNPEYAIGFETSNVHEYDSDGNEIHCHRKVFARTATLTITGHAATLSVTDSSLSPEEQAEMERLARATRAGKLLKATVKSDLVLTVMRLLDGEPGTLELGHVHDLLEDEMDGDLSAFATAKQLTRFNRSINHPDVLGLKARHATSKTDPPPNPMDMSEATRFHQEPC